MPPTSTGTGTVPVAIVPEWAPVALTARGRAACRLSEFQDCWNNLEPADRQWFAAWLNALLIDAVLADVAPAPTA